MVESDLHIGAMYDYGFYKNVELVNLDNVHVVLKDSSGIERYVYKDLFLKNAKLISNIDNVDTSSLKFYVIRSKAGTFYEKGTRWTADIKKAKTYNKIGSARIRLAHFLRDPHNIPDLVELSIGSYKIIDETKRINDNKAKRELREKKNMEFWENKKREEARIKYEQAKQEYEKVMYNMFMGDADVSN